MFAKLEHSRTVADGRGVLQDFSDGLHTGCVGGIGIAAPATVLHLHHPGPAWLVGLEGFNDEVSGRVAHGAFQRIFHIDNKLIKIV
ncbi:MULTISPECIES: hypothetical protein [Arthrobacter]|uniref:hypothetical protein n=1 Tax=Arthrobacter TaxID=1663 RepID=UPI003398EB44